MQPPGPTAAVEAVPEPAFAVEAVEPVRFAAGPTLSFRLRVEDRARLDVRSITLNVQLRVAATRRRYDEATRERLVGLFGAPEDWGRSLHSLLWTQAQLVVPRFRGATTVDLPVACTYDVEVAAAGYLDALRDGAVPLELLFSGTVFHADATGALRVTQIPWDCEAACELPVAMWRAAMDAHFPGTVWLRVERDAFDRLRAYRARRALPSWGAVVDELLREAP